MDGLALTALMDSLDSQMDFQNLAPVSSKQVLRLAYFLDC
jgi:hypothetical protein